MKIEKINEKQIKCSINKEDLSVRGISISELAYGSENAKSLFDEILKQAFLEVGFQSDDAPLIVEATPLASGNLILLVTKDMEPEELDTRFSKFSPDGETLRNLSEENSVSDFPLWETSSNQDNFESKTDDGFITFPEMLEEQKTEKAINLSSSNTTIKIFTFSSLASICEFARKLEGRFQGEASVYKNKQRGLYYLVLDYEENEKDIVNSIQNLLSEYSAPVKGNYATVAYIKEHFETIVKEDALTVLSVL